MVLELTRTYFPNGTNGKLECKGKSICNTIELPWRENETRVSCIPEGKYFIKKRENYLLNIHNNLFSLFFFRGHYSRLNKDIKILLTKEIRNNLLVPQEEFPHVYLWSPRPFHHHLLHVAF